MICDHFNGIEWGCWRDYYELRVGVVNMDGFVQGLVGMRQDVFIRKLAKIGGEIISSASLGNDAPKLKALGPPSYSGPSCPCQNGTHHSVMQ